MTSFRLLEDARLIVNDLVRARKDETIAIVTDHSRSAEAEALSIAVDEVGARFIIIDMSKVVDRVMGGGTWWEDPPRNLIAAVENSNVTIFVVDETYGFRLDHHLPYLFRTARQPNKDCSIFKVDLGMGTWGFTKDDIKQVTEVGRKIRSATRSFPRCWACPR
jgi:hypothetical protein